MALSVTDARAQVQRLLDDAVGGKRWTAGHVDAALAPALNKCMLDLIESGDHRFVQQLESSTLSTGLLSMTSQDPLLILAVAIKRSGHWARVRPQGRDASNEPFAAVRELRVGYVPNTSLDTVTPSNPLVSGPTFDALDEWVCARAAVRLAIVDGERPPALVALAADARQSILSQPQTPATRSRTRYRYLDRPDVSWSYRPEDKAIELVRRLDW